ncbi:unnamed protein product [Linum trigynum]|uniref:Uncharacterized protein n=1 Tax=Linum trigynum TaxID=586398 RepID=A0AAV2FSG1_9ROSI
MNLKHLKNHKKCRTKHSTRRNPRQQARTSHRNGPQADWASDSGDVAMGRVGDSWVGKAGCLVHHQYSDETR